MAKIFHQWCLNVIFLFVFTLSAFSTLNTEEIHPYYVSVVEINHNKEDKTLEISCKIFTDDFEKTLGKVYKASVDLISPKDKPAIEKEIGDYISKNLSISVDNKPVKFTFLGYEISEGAAWCYLQVENISAFKDLGIVNKILHDYTDKQVNIMHVTVNGGRKSSKLDFPNSVASFNF
jgi:hypothetical protein